LKPENIEKKIGVQMGIQGYTVIFPEGRFPDRRFSGQMIPEWLCLMTVDAKI